MRLVQTLELLWDARQYVAEGEKSVRQQRMHVERVKRRGEDPTEEIMFLKLLEEMQEQYVAHMDSLNYQVIFIIRPD